MEAKLCLLLDRVLLHMQLTPMDRMQWAYRKTIKVSDLAGLTTHEYGFLLFPYSAPNNSYDIETKN